MNPFVVSADLGQAADYTAISIIERQLWHHRKKAWFSPADLSPREVRVLSARQQGAPDVPLHVRHLDRIPLGTSYPEIVRTVAGIVRDPRLAERGVTLLVDATGVGRPVLDMFREQKLKPLGVTITGGDAMSRDGHDYRVPKRDLVAALQVCLQNGRLKIAASLPHAHTFQTEALNFKVTININTGHDSYAAWRENIHDDLVLSVAMATWFCDLKQPSRQFVSF